MGTAPQHQQQHVSREHDDDDDDDYDDNDVQTQTRVGHLGRYREVQDVCPHAAARAEPVVDRQVQQRSQVGTRARWIGGVRISTQYLHITPH